MKRLWYFCLIALGLNGVGCAGPTTPFGNPSNPTDVSGPDKPIRNYASQNKYDPVITIMPDKQVLHANSPMNVQIFDPQGVPQIYDFQVYYNGRDLTDKFLAKATKKEKGNIIQYDFKGIRLPAKKKHNIAIYYSRGGSNVGYWKSQAEPKCGFYELRKLRTTERFKVSDEIKKIISSVSVRHGINESLLAGLIAQESAYNPKAVSVVKALGLTQVTNLASKDIVDEDRDWPVHPLVRKLTPSRVKQYIYQNIINPKNDWRLEPSKSVSGGAAYLEFLQEYWSKPQNRKLLDEAVGVTDYTWAQVLLASYNSGAYRVKTAIKKYRENWLKAPFLNEASKYVPRIMSYCHHFSKPRILQ